MNEELKDIKDLVEIPDISFIIFILVIGMIVVIISVLIYLFIKYKKVKRPTKKEIMLKELKSLDFKDAKSSAYIFTKNAYNFLDEYNEKKYHNITQKLEIYKYKKSIPTMSDVIKDDMKEFISELHV